MNVPFDHLRMRTTDKNEEIIYDLSIDVLGRHGNWNIFCVKNEESSVR